MKKYLISLNKKAGKEQLRNKEQEGQIENKYGFSAATSAIKYNGPSGKVVDLR